MGSLKPGFFDEMKTFLDVHFRGEGTMVVGSVQDYLSMIAAHLLILKCRGKKVGLLLLAMNVMMDRLQFILVSRK
jgi:hypothetical protein